MTRLLAALPASLLLFLLMAPVVLADTPNYSQDPQEPVSGQGSYGIADDKVVTNAWFIVIFGIPLFLLAMSVLQWRLEKRKDARKAASKKLHGQERWQSGW